MRSIRNPSRHRVRLQRVVQMAWQSRSMLGPPLLGGVARCPLHRLVQRKGRRREEGLPRAAGPIIEVTTQTLRSNDRDGATLLRRTVPRS